MNRKEITDKGRSDLLFFGRAISPGTFTVPSAPFHKELADLYLDQFIRLFNVQAPRGHAKSSIMAGIGPLHDLAYDDHDTFIVLISKTEGHAVRLLQMIKDVLEFSEHWRALFGYWGRHASRAWKSAEVELIDPRTPSRRIMVLCRGAAQQQRGLKYINQRPTRVIYDDPEDENNVLTEESRDKTLTGLLKGIVPGLDPHYGRAGVIGTPIHSQGLVNTLESNPAWYNLKYKALNEVEGHEDSDDIETRYRALWPEVMPVSRLLDDKAAAEAIGRLSTWYSEYQCEIVGDEDQLFREEDLRYWNGELQWDLQANPYLEVAAKGPAQDMEEFDKPLHIPVNLFMGVDPASSTQRTADYSVIFTIAIDEDKNIYCIDYFRKRVKPLSLAGEIVRRFKLYRPQRTQVESTGYQEMLRQYLREHVPEYIPGLEIKNTPRNKKSDRLAGLQPEFAMGKVYLRTWMTDFEEELLLFPRAKHDDLLDGFYYARKGAYIPYHDIVTTEQEKRSRVPSSFRDWMVL